MKNQRKVRPLSRSLENQIKVLCNRPAPYTIEPVPFEDLRLVTSLVQLSEECHKLGRWVDRETGALLGQRIPVYSGHSDRTIWSCPAMNHLFRAWHDSHHLAIGAEFDVPGEKRVAQYACGMIEGKAEKAMLWAELWGQVMYHNTYGAFPINQRAFVRDCIVLGIESTIMLGGYHNA